MAQLALKNHKNKAWARATNHCSNMKLDAEKQGENMHEQFVNLWIIKLKHGIREFPQKKI